METSSKDCDGSVASPLVPEAGFFDTCGHDDGLTPARARSRLLLNMPEVARTRHSRGCESLNPLQESDEAENDEFEGCAVPIFSFDIVTRTTDRCTGRVVGIRISADSRAITALVIRPDAQHRSEFVVPKRLVNASSPFVHLNCTSSELEHYGKASVVEVMPAPIGGASYPSWKPLQQVQEDLTNPFGRIAVGRTRALLPPSEVELVANQPVFATDGVAGRLKGVVMSENLGMVRDLVLERAHRPRGLPMLVPINVLTDWRSLELSLTRTELNALIDTKSRQSLLR
jgi:hypothetical protein